jgi:hypothetical protein
VRGQEHLKTERRLATERKLLREGVSLFVINISSAMD